ncbi:MAG: crossover junction endodeoxyribonuclease RuvC [Chitinophagaceae bacterium]|nr:crossover junction endodeoxyribonuclease RuvC [Chitinophagaceae bacterium]
MQKPVKIILGIDPGTLVMGHGIVAVNGNSMQLLEMSVLKLSGKKDNYERLQMIHQQVVSLVKKYHPDEFAIESPFFGKNVQSMLKLGRAQGVAIAAAMSAGLPVTEYSPKKIKQSITGNGNADKEQVWKMLQHILSLKEKPRHFDATDALAVAICHHFQGKLPATPSATGKKKTKGVKNSWDDFITKNPHRILKK